jgi:hypothetical protein
VILVALPVLLEIQRETTVTVLQKQREVELEQIQASCSEPCLLNVQLTAGVDAATSEADERRHLGAGEEPRTYSVWKRWHHTCTATIAVDDWIRVRRLAGYLITPLRCSLYT